jgi:hypothetical protein
LFGLLFIAICVAFGRSSHVEAVVSKYDQIQIGMRRDQVYELMNDLSNLDQSAGPCLDVWSLKDRYILFVYYGTGHGERTSATDADAKQGDELVVEEVSLVDRSEPSDIQSLLGELGLWPIDNFRVKRAN